MSCELRSCYLLRRMAGGRLQGMISVPAQAIDHWLQFNIRYSYIYLYMCKITYHCKLMRTKIASLQSVSSLRIVATIGHLMAWCCMQPTPHMQSGAYWLRHADHRGPTLQLIGAPGCSIIGVLICCEDFMNMNLQAYTQCRAIAVIVYQTYFIDFKTRLYSYSHWYTVIIHSIIYNYAC